MVHWDSNADFSDLKGKTFSEVKRHYGTQGEEIVFVTVEGERFRQYHSQSCCESVEIDDIAGDLGDLVDSPILLAEEVSNSSEHPPDKTFEWEPTYFTWTFYKLSTIKGSVTIRWFGTSNGYYSESVSLYREMT